VRPAEDIEAKVSGLYSKISHPVLANLKLTAGKDVSLLETYPPQLPDLFHGEQLVVLGRYSGQGAVALKLSGTVGSQSQEFVYETTFPGKTDQDRSFVEQVWARRKVGYLLDQIRANGEKKELVDEVVTLAKKYGIATPYTSYLIVPDAPIPVATPGPGRPPILLPRPLMGGRGGAMPYALTPPAPGAAPSTVTEFAKGLKGPDELGEKRDKLEDDRFRRAGEGKDGAGQGDTKALQEALDRKEAYAAAASALRAQRTEEVQAGKLGVDLSVQSNLLKSESRPAPTAVRQAFGRTCLEIGGVWIDDQFQARMPLVTVKALSDAYFRILELHPQVKEVFQLGNHLVWVTPSGTALVIDTSDGKDKLSDDEINQLFAVRK
jgi:Ca-activated chloride channel family protein